MGLVSKNKVITDLASQLHLFHEVIYKAWNEWLSIPIKSRQKLCSRSRASCIHNFMVDHAASLLSGAKVNDLSKLKVFSINEYAIRFKKLNEDLKSQNQLSEQVKKFRGQEQLDGLTTIYNLEVGYMLDPFEQNIQSCHLVCPNGDRVFWDIEILENEIQSYNHKDLFVEDEDLNEENMPTRFKQKKKGEVLPFNKVSDYENGQDDK